MMIFYYHPGYVASYHWPSRPNAYKQLRMSHCFYMSHELIME